MFKWTYPRFCHKLARVRSGEIHRAYCKHILVRPWLQPLCCGGPSQLHCYAVEQRRTAKGIQPEMNLRGVFTSDDKGNYSFRSVYPRYYPIPFDGTVGKMLQALDRNHNRPAHLHFIVSAPKHEKLITHIFTPDCPWLKDDAVFGVKESLIADFKMVDDPKKAAELGMPNPFRICEWNVVLTKSK